MTQNRVLGASFTVQTYQSAAGNQALTTFWQWDELAILTATGFPVTVTLAPVTPQPPQAGDGDRIVIKDASGNAGAIPITIQATGGTTILTPSHAGGPVTSMQIAANFGEVTFTYSFTLNAWMASA